MAVAAELCFCSGGEKANGSFFVNHLERFCFWISVLNGLLQLVGLIVFRALDEFIPILQFAMKIAENHTD